MVQLNKLANALPAFDAGNADDNHRLRCKSAVIAATRRLQDIPNINEELNGMLGLDVYDSTTGLDGNLVKDLNAALNDLKAFGVIINPQPASVVKKVKK